MPSITLTLPTAGTVITAGLHANNYTSLQSLLNGGLDAANWGTGKIFAPSKLLQEGGGDLDLMAWDQATTIWKPKAASVLGQAALGLVELFDRVSITTDIQNSAAEADLYRKTITGNKLGTKRSARLSLKLDYLHNNVAADTLTLKIIYGATTLWADTYNLGNVIGAQRHPIYLVIDLENLNATNSQLMTAVGLVDIANVGAPTTGIGKLGAAGANLNALGIASEDSTVNQDIAVRAAWSAASVNNSVRVRAAKLEIV